MKHQKIIKNQNGFTLIEIIAVLVIISVLGTVFIQKYTDLGTASMHSAIDAGIMELNSRENLTWANQVISNAGYDDDQNIVNAMDYNLRGGYAWSVAPSKTGGTAEFQGLNVPLTRTESDISQPAVWSR